MSEQRSGNFISEESKVFTMLMEFHGEVHAIGTGSVEENGVFECLLRAALVKSYEYTSFVNSMHGESHSYFTTPTLRGLCEDLIALTFIGSLDESDRNSVAVLLLKKNVVEGIETQHSFFKEHREWQPVLGPSGKGSEEIERDLEKISARLGWKGRSPWPSVSYMAKASSLESVYNYIYSATSKWVHFSPHVLMRTGWGGDKESISNITKWKFTTSNFTGYYRDFNRTYSLMLFIRLIKGPARALISEEMRSKIVELEAKLNEPLRWPEAVTFEEMNKQEPNAFFRMLLRAAHEDSGKK